MEQKMRSKEEILKTVEKQLEVTKFLLEEIDENKANNFYQELISIFYKSDFFEKCSNEKCSNESQKRSKFDSMRDLINN